MFDCHVHSSFSFDSKTPCEASCEAAIKLGFEGLAFTDHLDFDYPGYENCFTINFEEYIRHLELLEQKYEKKLNIIKGIEVGIQPQVIADTRHVVESHPFDYVLASVHIIDGLDPYEKHFYEGKTKMDAYTLYLQKILEMMNTYDKYDMVGHLDYIIRYAPYEERSLKYNDCRELLDMLLKKVITNDKGIEVNTGSYRKKDQSTGIPTYDIEILKRYRALGGEKVCLSSDAHFEGDVGYGLRDFSELLVSAGFQYTTHFKKRKPIFSKIR